MKQKCYICLATVILFMRLYTIVKNDLREVEEYINSQGIEKDQIVNIFSNGRGEYILIYYGE